MKEVYLNEDEITKFQNLLNKLFKEFRGRNNRFVMYYGTKDYMVKNRLKWDLTQ